MENWDNKDTNKKEQMLKRQLQENA